MAKNTKTGEANVPAVRRRCFLIGPIGSVNTDTRRHADWLLKGIVEPVFKSSFPEFDVVRSDRIAAPGMIDAQVINLLLDADLVIADMSKLNPNAFYELGIRHMAQKPTVHMFLVGEEIPFDVAPYRAIGFSLQDPDDLAAAQKQLRESVEASLAHDFKVENPVTRLEVRSSLSKMLLLNSVLCSGELKHWKLDSGL